MEQHEENEEQESAPPRALMTRRREFAGMTLSGDNAATAALIAKARADVEARWLMVMRMPRNLDDSRQMMIKECRRNGFAEQAIYAIPIGGKTVEGLTIRFAEVAARCFGNMPIETQTIYDSDLERIVRVTVTDLESNVTWSRDITVKKTVERKQTKRGQRIHGERTNSYGDRVYIVDASDDEVNVKEASAISKASRTGILRLIPGHLQDEMFDMCKKLAADKSAKDPDGERVKLLDAFADLNVMPSDLEQWLGHDTTKTSPAELDQLRKVFVAVREGEIAWPDALRAKLEAKPQSAPPTNGAATAPAAEPQKESTRKKGGAAALKEQLKNDKPAEPAQPAPAKEPTAFDKAAADARAKAAQREAEPGWMAGETRGATPNGGAPVEDVPDFEERKCAACGVAIECAKAEPPGARCYACRQA